MNPTLLHIYDHYLYALLALVGTAIGVAGLQWLLSQSRWAAWARSLQGVVPPFINIIGVLFGLTLAFLANDCWRRLNIDQLCRFKIDQGLKLAF